MVAVIGRFILGFVAGFVGVTVLLWLAARIGHALIWIMLLGPIVGGSLFGFAVTAARRRQYRRA